MKMTRMLTFGLALAMAAGVTAVWAQRASTNYQTAAIADRGVQEAVKFAFQTQKQKEMGNLVLSAVVAAEQQTLAAVVNYRVCLSVQRGAPHEQATAIVSRVANDWTKWTLQSFTYGPCRLPAPAR
jgi:hypothetical protein